MHKEKILILASTFPRWKDDKIPNFIYQLALNLLKYYEVHVLAPHFKDAKVFEIMDGIHVHRFVYGPPSMEILTYKSGVLNNLSKNLFIFILLPFYLLSNFFTLFYLLLKYKFKIVNGHWIIPSGPIALPLKPFFRFKLILSSHGGDIFGVSRFSNLKFLGIGFFINLSLKLTNHITAVSSAIKAEIKKYLKNNDDKISIVPMGIKFDDFHKQDRIVPDFKSKKPRILFVGRLVKVKAPQYLIQALDKLRNENIDFECTIAGDGMDRETLEQMVKDLKLEDRVKFLGYVVNTQVPELLYSHDIFVSTSISEGLPTAYMEAMASGIPVVVTNTLGIEDLVKNMDNGIVYQMRDVDALVNSIKLVISDNSLYSKLSQNAVQTAGKFDWNIIAAKFYEIFEKN